MLLRKVEKFMSTHAMPATKFGRLAASDPRFVLDLRMGRTPRAQTEARIRRWMADYEASLRTPLAHTPSLGVFETKEFSHAV